MDWDSIKSRFGGEWYDSWWCSAFDWLALQEGGHCDWWVEEYHTSFYKEINAGWYEMYPQPEVGYISLKDHLQNLANEIQTVC